MEGRKESRPPPKKPSCSFSLLHVPQYFLYLAVTGGVDGRRKQLIFIENVLSPQHYIKCIMSFASFNHHKSPVR